MSIAACFVLVACVIAAALALFGLCVNLLYWYENLNGEAGAVPRAAPSLAFCVRKYGGTLASFFLCGALYPLGPFCGILLGRGGKRNSGLPPVILLHGLYNNASAWLYTGGKLRRKGYAVSVFSYKSFGVSLQDVVSSFDARFAELEKRFPGQKPVIIGHSLGGVLARTWLLHPENQERAAALITLGTPHKGSKLAVFASGELAKHLRPGSELMRRLAEAPPLAMPCAAIASLADDAVLPASSLAPPHYPEGGWKLRFCAPVGHFHTLFHASAFAIIEEELEDLGQPGA